MIDLFNKNSNIIPDDAAGAIADLLYARYISGVEYSIENDHRTYDFDQRLKKKCEWHYEYSFFYKVQIDRKIEDGSEFYREFCPGNGFISRDRFNVIHVINRKSLIKILDAVDLKLREHNMQMSYIYYYSKVHKMHCLEIWAYISYEEKLLRDVRNEGPARFPKPDRREIVLYEPDLTDGVTAGKERLDIIPSGITVLTKNEYEKCRRYIGYKDYDWFLKPDEDSSLSGVPLVTVDGNVRHGDWVVRHGVVPAVILSGRGLKTGDKILYAGFTWTVIREDLILADNIIGTCPFKYYYKDKVTYETSVLKTCIDGWFDKHKNNPLFKGV